MSGTVFLVPNTIGGNAEDTISPAALAISRHLHYWVAEDAKSARRFLRSIHPDLPLQSIRISTLDKDSTTESVGELLRPVEAGEDVGVLSEAGCPGIADPGAALVKVAHQRELKVVPLIGPSSILLALMASGMNGQHFIFHGYLPVDTEPLVRKIREIESASGRNNRTEIFIETPYRNERLMKHLVATLASDTLLCVASNLTVMDQRVRTMTVSQWKKTGIAVPNGTPTVYLVSAGGNAMTTGKKPAPLRNNSKSTR